MDFKKVIIVLVIALLFPWLFYEHNLGLNLLVFNLLVFAGLFTIGKLNLKSGLNRYISMGTLLSAFFIVYNGSELAVVVNILSLFLLAGTSLFPIGRNLLYSSLLSVINFFTAQKSFITLFKDAIPQGKGLRIFLRFLRLIIIPLIVVFIFILIYKTANPVFEGIVKSFFDDIESFSNWFFENIEFTLFMTFVFGFLLSNYFFLGKANQTIAELDENSSDNLYRKRRKSFLTFKTTALKDEYKSAIVLFAMLNVLILIVNVIDIWWVWFNFEWDGDYLKQFVHEGTYLLILSIIISLFISIYYFRGNINFLKKNTTLKHFAFLWLAQNAILTISVGIRNFWYINYFSLAYLRIGVFFFLILTLFSIYTVYSKIRLQKSTYFLFRKNTLAAYILLIVMASFNWDIIIAKYNFSHSETAFVHFDFLANLSDNALPYLDKSKEELAKIDTFQTDKFPFRQQYMTSAQYFNQIENEKQNFLKIWPDCKWQEWNLASERAFRKLTE